MKVGGAQALQTAVDQPRRGQVGVVGEDLREPAAQQTECRQVRAAQVRLDQLQVLDHLTGGQLIGLTVVQAPEVRCREDRWLGTAKEEASSAVSVRPAGHGPVLSQIVPGHRGIVLPGPGCRQEGV